MQKSTSSRTYKKEVDGRKRQVPSAFVKDFILWDNRSFPKVSAMKNNQILVRGTVNQEPLFRVTPKGRKITELLVVVGRASGKSDYIPCIAWNENAAIAANLKK